MILGICIVFCLYNFLGDLILDVEGSLDWDEKYWSKWESMNLETFIQDQLNKKEFRKKNKSIKNIREYERFHCFFE